MHTWKIVEMVYINVPAFDQSVSAFDESARCIILHSINNTFNGSVYYYHLKNYFCIQRLPHNTTLASGLDVCLLGSIHSKFSLSSNWALNPRHPVFLFGAIKQVCRVECSLFIGKGLSLA